jgi:signal recognition particle subunit SRP54
VTITNDHLLSVLNEITRALVEADVAVSLVKGMKDRIKSKIESGVGGDNKKKLIQKLIQDELVGMLESTTPTYKLSKSKANVIMFVGLQGAGKTTSIAKYAGYYARKGWKVSMVCCDSFRAGAYDQLKQNATKLRVPFYGSYTEADPVKIASVGVESFKSQGYEIILIDTSGRHRQESALFTEMQEISSVVSPDNVIFVMDGTQGQAVYDQASSFNDAVTVGSVIVTKLDGHAKGGGAISAVAATNAPIAFLGSGEHFDDFEPFNAKSFVSKLLGYGDVRGMFEEMASMQDKKKMEITQKNIIKGKYTLRDMHGQFENMGKMGGISKMASMMPGMGNIGQQMGGMGMDDQFNRMAFIMNSMSDDELYC